MTLPAVIDSTIPPLPNANTLEGLTPEKLKVLKETVPPPLVRLAPKREAPHCNCTQFSDGMKANLFVGVDTQQINN